MHLQVKITCFKGGAVFLKHDANAIVALTNVQTSTFIKVWSKMAME